MLSSKTDSVVISSDVDVDVDTREQVELKVKVESHILIQTYTDHYLDSKEQEENTVVDIPFWALRSFLG